MPSSLGDVVGVAPPLSVRVGDWGAWGLERSHFFVRLQVAVVVLPTGNVGNAQWVTDMTGSSPDPTFATRMGFLGMWKEVPSCPLLRWVVVMALGYWCANARSWMPGQRPWKVDCAVGSPMRSVAVVVASLLGCEDGEERGSGDSGGGGALTPAFSRSWCGGLIWWRQTW